MEIFRENKPFLIIIAIVIAISGFFSIQRIGVENSAKTVDVILDYVELEKMAKQSDEDLSWWLSEFKKMGITKVGLGEENLKTLSESDWPVEVNLLHDISKDADWKGQYPQGFVQAIENYGYDDFDVVVEAKSKESYEFISQSIQARVDGERFFAYPENEQGYLFINGTVDDALYKQTEKLVNSDGKGYTQNQEIASSRILYVSLGLLPEKIQLLQSAGMEIIPRTAENKGWNGLKFAQATVSGYEALGEAPDYLILAGQAVLGQDDNIDFISKYINDNDITVGLVENTNQRGNIMPKGITGVIENINYDTVRVFSVWDYIQNRYQYYNYGGSEEIENTLFRAVTERNVKLIYYKPIKEKDDDQKYVTDVKEYQKLFAGLENRLDRHEITFGSINAEKPFEIPLLAKIAIGIGCVAAALIALGGLIALNKKVKWGLLAIGTLGVCGAYFVAPNLAALLTSFGASVMIPCVVTVMMFQYSKESEHALGINGKPRAIITKAAIALIATVVFCLFGGMMTAIPISGTSYMLELDIFRGVKAAQLLPLVFFVGIYLSYFGFNRKEKEENRQTKLQMQDVKNLLNVDIKVWMILIGTCILAAGYIYIARTGHESGVEPTNIEMIIRNFLENVLYARPRSKEFLVAFPCLMLFIYCVVKKLRLFSFVFGLAATIGFTSVVNTFMHIRTPMALGFIRTGYSLVLGLVFGILCVIIFELLHRLYRKKGKHKHE